MLFLLAHIEQPSYPKAGDMLMGFTNMIIITLNGVLI